MQIKKPTWNSETANSIKAIIFDMDGTLFSSEQILHPAYLNAIRDFNIQYNQKIVTPSLQEILAQVGQPARIIFQKLFPDLSSEKQIALNSLSLKNLCNAIVKGGGELYPGIKEALHHLGKKKIKLFIASNGRRSYISAILQGFALESFFVPFKCIEDEATQTKAEIIISYLKDNSLFPEQVVMVGDRASDIEAAREANTWFIGVTWGHGPKAEIENADIILDSTEELIKLYF